MPTSQYFYADTDAKQTSGPGTSIRRRSQGIHRKSLNKTQTFRDPDNSDGDCVADPDETVLEDDKDETILLSFEEEEDADKYCGGDDNDGGVRQHHSTVDDTMDVDQYGNSKGRHRPQPSTNAIPREIPRGNGGFLSDDPLTSSTKKTTPFNNTRAKQGAIARSHAQVSNTERIHRLANQFSSDVSDNENSMEMSEQEFDREVVRKRAQQGTMLAESQPHTQPSHHSAGQHESDDTDKIVNHEDSSSFDSTQTWEREIRGLESQCLPSTHEKFPWEKNDNEPNDSSSRTNSFSSQPQLDQINSFLPRQHNNEQINQISTSRTTYQAVLPNPYLRKEPLPPPQKIAMAAPKMSSEQTSPQQQAHTDERETWQEEALRSFLIDLLVSFPSHYFNVQEDTPTSGNQTLQLATEINDDDESPHSTTSQRVASSKLNRQRLFDAASRCLARSAIASRHGTNCGSSRNSGERKESPDFEPPSPRSLPPYLSVMNVYDDSNRERNPAHVGSGQCNGIFSGRSVHGRSARTLRLASNPHGEHNLSHNMYSSWSLEQLAFGSLILAAQVCYESSNDWCVDEKMLCLRSNIVVESGRSAGFAQRSSNQVGKNISRHSVSWALVGSSLGFLATAFACLESDIVFSVLKAPLKTSDSSLQVTVFDALCDFAPVPAEIASTDDHSGISTLSFLALSRGFEAVIDVARHSSTDPCSSCASYTSPHDVCGMSAHGTIDTGVDKSGVGWLSALGRDLGLKLEDYRNSRPRHMRLSEIALCSYDHVLSYNPMGVGDDGDNKKRSNCRSDLFIDVQDKQGTSTFAFRQHTVVADRVFAANATFLMVMLHAGIISGWLLFDHENVDDRDLADSNGLLRVNNLCQKLFNIIETVARRCRSANLANALPDEGDCEAVCASSLSLLLLALPKYVDKSPPLSLSTSFRQMGNNSGSVEDLLQSPLIRNMVELAFTWQSSNDDNGIIIAAINARYIVSELCIVGGTSLVCTHFRDKLDEFLQNLMLAICERGRKTTSWHDCSSFGSSLFLALNLHTGSPITIRQILRNWIEIASSSGDDYAKYFVIGLLHLANDSYSVSSRASSLLRALIDSNPGDRIRDRLSLMLLRSFDAENISTAKHALRLLIECAYTSVPCNPCFITRYHPRRCLLGDLLCVCIHTTHANSIFASSLSDDVIGQFVDAIKGDYQQSQNIDSLSGAMTLTLVTLLIEVANNRCNDIDDSVLEKQSRTKERLHTIRESVMTIIELAVSQGMSVDVTQRAFKLQNALVSLSDERFVALCITNANSLIAIREKTLRDQLTKSQLELSEIDKRNRNILLIHDNLTNAFHDQRLSYERRIEYIKSESRIAARESEILVDERKQAEELYAKERATRLRSEEKLEQVTLDSYNHKSRIKCLEELLKTECQSRKHSETELETCKKELSKLSMELERSSSKNCDLVDKLTMSEERVAELLAIKKSVESDLEDACSKLIHLATIYQRNDVDLEKYKAELRSTMNTANKQTDKAIAKYENSKKQNSLLSKQLEEVTAELNSSKNHRANIQRMRKNAPVSYLNQLHLSGKENTRDER